MHDPYSYNYLSYTPKPSEEIEEVRISHTIGIHTTRQLVVSPQTWWGHCSTMTSLTVIYKVMHKRRMGNGLKMIFFQMGWIFLLQEDISNHNSRLLDQNEQADRHAHEEHRLVQ